MVILGEMEDQDHLDQRYVEKSFFSRPKFNIYFEYAFFSSIGREGGSGGWRHPP